MQRLALLLAACGIIALPACSGGGPTPPLNFSCDWSDPTCPIYIVAPAPSGPCAYPSGVAPTMIYPAEGASNVPDDLQVVVSDKAASLSSWLPNSGNVYYADLLTHPATQITFSNFSGPQSDYFTLQSTSGNTIELSAGYFGTVQPQTHYYVYLQYVYYDGSNNQCYANGPIGDFTTQ